MKITRKKVWQPEYHFALTCQDCNRSGVRENEWYCDYDDINIIEFNNIGASDAMLCDDCLDDLKNKNI